MGGLDAAAVTGGGGGGTDLLITIEIRGNENLFGENVSGHEEYK